MFEVHFQLRYSRCGKDKNPDYSRPAAIYFTINVNGVFSSPRSTYLKVMRDDWDGTVQKIKGHGEDVQYKNRRLKRIKAEIDALEQELSAMMEHVTAQYIADVYTGKKLKRITVLDAFENHLKTLRNPEIETERLQEKSLKKWERAKWLVEQFLKSVNKKDLPAMFFTLPMAESYRSYLMKTFKFGKDHTSRNISYLSTAFQTAKKDGHLQENPIFDVELPRNRPKKAQPLTLPELQRLIDFTSDDELLTKAADIAVFMCFTGLDHCDYMRFRADSHLAELAGYKVIRITRQKMYRKGNIPEPANIPILPEAMAILRKYNFCLPLLKYDTVRKQVKIIMSMIGVNKRITMKTLRKTCGSYLLNKGVRLEIIREIMGHDTIALTEKIYTIVYPETIIAEFKHLLD